MTTLQRSSRYSRSWAIRLRSRAGGGGVPASTPAGEGPPRRGGARGGRGRPPPPGPGVGDRILLATDEGSVIGLLTLHFTPVIHRDSEVGRVTALVVARRARRLGVGALLMAEAERIVQRAGATRVELTSGHDRPEAHAFYLRLGYHDEGVRFAKVFDWQPAGEESSRA